MFHWVKDLQRISREPTLDGIEYKYTYKEKIDAAMVRADIHKYNANESDSLSKSSDLGKRKKKNEWIPWSQSLRNYLSTILEQNGLSLSYVIRENPDPKYDEEDDEAYDFFHLCINCAPLYGLVYKTDARKVHQQIHIFVQGGNDDTWIKPRDKKKYGRIDFKHLQAHYGVEYNKALRIKGAEVLRNTVNYKN